MGIQPSASRTALLLACPRPFDPNVEEDPDLPGEPARYGSAFHAVLAACLRSPAKKPLEKEPGKFAKHVDRAVVQYDVKSVAGELAGHVKGSVKVLRNWLKREKLEPIEIEAAYAVRPDGDAGGWTYRTILPHDEEHRYAVDALEIPGTVDLIAVSTNRKRSVTIDHKTGRGEEDSFAQPTKIPQMRTLGLVDFTTGSASSTGEVGIFHADRRGLPIVYTEPYEPLEKRAHVRELKAALSMIGRGFLRPGAQCKRCHARETCPAWAADLLAESTSVLVSSAITLAVEPIDPKMMLALPTDDAPVALEARAGALYELLKKFRSLDKAGTAEIKRLVKTGSIIETRDGKTLALQEQTFETLSKKSVLEALGPIAGEKELKRLREKGAIRESTREMLVGEK